MGGFQRSARERAPSWLRIFAILTLLLGSVALFMRQAEAVHDDGLFELDGNAVDETKADPDLDGEDWTNVCPANTPAGNESEGECLGDTAASSSSFVVDGTNASIFTTGGSKDDLNVTSWRHTNGSVPDKDELSHAYAARYDDTLYFGANRVTTNGDAQIGFWFFQSQVVPVAGGTFSGQHSDGDILVLSDFTKGGGLPTVRVFEWNGPGGTIAGQGAINGTLDLLFGSTEQPQDCDIVGDGDPVCATVNDVPEPSPWAYAPKSGTADIFPAGALYEGGIDLGFLDLEDECFSSFLAETRSSQSVDATLKDFVGGNFDSCQATVTTSPSATVANPVTPGTPVTDTVTITGSGVGNPPTPTGNVTFYLCGPIASPAVCTSIANPVGSPVPLLQSVAGTATATSAAVDTSTLTPGRYCFLVTWPGDLNYAGPFSHNQNAGQSTDSECFSVAKINTNTVTTPVDGSGASVTSIVLGNPIFDRAVVTGTSGGGDPTGLVKFFLCGPDDLADANDVCDTGGTQVGTPLGGETLASDGLPGTFTSSATSDTTTPTETGRYCFRADYLGSTIYNSSSDFASTECFQVVKLPTNTVTTPVDANGAPVSSIVLGGTIHDLAVVTGDAVGGDPTGTVQFFVCGPDDLDPDATDVCDEGGTQVGTPAAGETLVSDGVPGTFTSSVTSEAFEPDETGRWCFRAVYSGNTPYLGSSDSSTTECFTVVKLPTNTVTTPVDADGDPVSSIVLGGSIHDLAVVTGSAGGGDPTGSVQFFVCGPAELDPVTETCDEGGTQVGTPAAGETLVPDEVADTFTSSVTSEPFTPDAPGTWCFRAVYSGNTPYLGSSDSSETECFLVVDTSTVSSAQNWLPNDSATVVLGSGGTASGTVVFTLYETADCTGTAVSGQQYMVALVNGQASTSNTDYFVTVNKTVSWKVQFVPGNPAAVQSATHCETSTVTINNN